MPDGNPMTKQGGSNLTPDAFYEGDIARLREALTNVRNGYASQAKFADFDCAVHFREFVRRLDAALAGDA